MLPMDKLSIHSLLFYSCNFYAELILELRKVAKIVQRIPKYFHPDSSNVNIFITITLSFFSL